MPNGEERAPRSPVVLPSMYRTSVVALSRRPIYRPSTAPTGIWVVTTPPPTQPNPPPTAAAVVHVRSCSSPSCRARLVSLRISLRVPPQLLSLIADPERRCAVQVPEPPTDSSETLYYRFIWRLTVVTRPAGEFMSRPKDSRFVVFLLLGCLCAWRRKKRI